jgi:DNA-binding YbaB/EbfC family protein
VKDFGDLMKQAQQMQASLQDAQAQIAQMEVHGESGAGMVKVVMNGRYEVKSVALDSALLSEDKEVLEDLLAAACNDTVRKVEKAQSEKMQDIGGGLLGGLNLPFGKMPF